MIQPKPRRSDIALSLITGLASIGYAPTAFGLRAFLPNHANVLNLILLLVLLFWSSAMFVYVRKFRLLASGSSVFSVLAAAFFLFAAWSMLLLTAGATSPAIGVLFVLGVYLNSFGIDAWLKAEKTA
ncbi:MAG: hypothetical protein I8H94_02215 [Rhodobacteraceae bacterium]|nr:hypothetical protein [Paracoccaceae bacterium]